MQTDAAGDTESGTDLPDGLWRIEGSAANAFLVRDGDGEDAPLFLVDAGVPGDADAIRATISNAGYGLQDIDAVLLTHYDYDHVGALASLPELDCPVYAHEPDASFLDGTDTPGLWPHKALLQRVSGAFLDDPGRPVERVADGESGQPAAPPGADRLRRGLPGRGRLPVAVGADPPRLVPGVRRKRRRPALPQRESRRAADGLER